MSGPKTWRLVAATVVYLWIPGALDRQCLSDEIFRTPGHAVLAACRPTVCFSVNEISCRNRFPLSSRKGMCKLPPHTQPFTSPYLKMNIGDEGSDHGLNFS